MTIGQYTYQGIAVPIQNTGAPVAGTNAVQTLTIGGTPTGGTFKLSYEGISTAAITWSATNATLIANIDVALEALGGIGAGGVVTAAGSLTAGIGTITLTFSGTVTGLKPVTTLTVSNNSLTGTAPTLAVATTTPGVAASGRNAPTGAQLVNISNGDLYINTSTTAQSPTYTKVGTQS